MSLRRKLIIKDTGLLLSLLLMIVVSVWGFHRQRLHVKAALAEYAALRRVEVSEIRFLNYRQSANVDDLDASRYEMRRYKALVAQYDTGLPPEITSDLQRSAKLKTKVLLAGLYRLDNTVPENSYSSPDQLTCQFADLISLCSDFVNRTSTASTADLHAALTGVGTVAVITIVMALSSSLWQYQRIMVPLNRLRDWCRQTAAGDFSAPYRPTADQEYVDLGRDVNRMAEDLAAFYRRLEERVATKSRQLVQSERLASVGYLAAGVAHEINTPLNVVSGYAELSIKRLSRALSVDSELVQSLEIIRGEAFRCKEITGKLLSLARGSGETSELVSMKEVATTVVTLVEGLRAFKTKKVIVITSADDACEVRANPSQLKQVVINLLINAAEAIGEKPGEIKVTIRRSGSNVKLSVHDDGRGMTPDLLELVFEPFFTQKRGAGSPGTGLGLSITHAIVTDHGGHIVAETDGPGRGATFTVTLPAALKTEPIPAATSGEGRS